MTRAGLKSTLAVLAAVGLIALWALRPGMEVSSPTATPLQIEMDCDSALRVCAARSDALDIALQLGPPVRPMQAFEIQVRSLRGPLGADARVDVQFQMRAMDMGINRYRLAIAADGVWRGTAILPVCASGRSDWIAQLDIRAGGRHWIAELPFTVVQP